jgi:hypothetical protein
MGVLRLWGLLVRSLAGYVCLAGLEDGSRPRRPDSPIRGSGVWVYQAETRLVAPLNRLSQSACLFVCPDSTRSKQECHLRTQLVFRRCCTLQKVWVRFQPWIEPLVKHRKGFRSKPPHHLQRGGVGLVSFLRLFTPGYPITFHCCCEKEIVNLMFVYYPVHLLPTASLANPLSPFPPPPPNNGKSKSSLRSSCSKQIYFSFNMSR